MTNLSAISSFNSTSSAPALDIRAPFFLGLTAFAVFAAAILGAAAVTPVETSIVVTGKVAPAGRAEVVRHARGGIVADVKVAEGQAVQAGDVLVTFDTTAIDQQLGALNSQLENAAKQVAIMRAEVTTSTDLVARKLATAGHLKELDLQFKNASADAARLTAQISQAEAELEKSVVRAPVTGRIGSLSASMRGAVVLPGASLAEISPEDKRLSIDIRLTPEQAERTTIGMPARVNIPRQSLSSDALSMATLVWKSSERTLEKRSGEAGYAARVEFTGPHSTAEAGTPRPVYSHVDVSIVTGQQKLLNYMIDPDPALTETQQ